MKELKFKTLMKDGEFATITTLPGTIRPEVISIIKPVMFDDGATIKMLKAIYRRACEASKPFAEDLSRCYFVDITVTVHDKSDEQ